MTTGFGSRWCSPPSHGGWMGLEVRAVCRPVDSFHIKSGDEKFICVDHFFFVHGGVVKSTQKKVPGCWHEAGLAHKDLIRYLQAAAVRTMKAKRSYRYIRHLSCHIMLHHLISLHHPMTLVRTQDGSITANTAKLRNTQNGEFSARSCCQPTQSKPRGEFNCQKVLTTQREVNSLRKYLRLIIVRVDTVSWNS